MLLGWTEFTCGEEHVSLTTCLKPTHLANGGVQPPGLPNTDVLYSCDFSIQKNMQGGEMISSMITTPRQSCLACLILWRSLVPRSDAAGKCPRLPITWLFKSESIIPYIIGIKVTRERVQVRWLLWLTSQG